MENGSDQRQPPGNRNFILYLLLGIILIGAGIYAVLHVSGMLDPKTRATREIESEGGTRYTFGIEADPALVISDSDKEMAVDVLWKRFESFEIDDVWIERVGDDTIIIEVPNSAGPIDIEGLTRAGILEFRMAHPDFQSHVGTDPADPPMVPGADFLPYAGDPTRAMLVSSKTEIDGSAVKRAWAGNEIGSWQIYLDLNSVGGTDLYDLSKKHNIGSGTGLPFAIIIDGEILSTPVFNEPIAGGEAAISGDFTDIEAKSLAITMQTPIPFSLNLLSEETLAATR